MPRPRKPIDESLPPVRQRIARNLRAAREAGGWTTQQCADDVGVTLDAWHKWESADRSVPSDSLDVIAAAVGLTASELVGDAE